MISITSVFRILLTISTVSSSIHALPSSLSNYEVTEEPIFGVDEPGNSRPNNLKPEKPAFPTKYGNKIPENNFGINLNNFFKKLFQNVPGNAPVKNDDILQDKLRTLLGNRHIYLELLHQFSPHPWFKPFYDKFQAVQEILRDPNFTLPTAPADVPSSGTNGNFLGCGCFPNFPDLINGIPPQKDEGNGENSGSSNSTTNSSSNDRSKSGGSKFFAFGSRPAPPYNFNRSLRKQTNS